MIAMKILAAVVTISIAMIMNMAVMASNGPVVQSSITLGSDEAPGSFNPIITNSYLETSIEQALFDNLFRMDDTGRLIPSLATGIPTLANKGISEDGKSYLINLRKGVRWHDGFPFTAEDVLFTAQAIRMDNVFAPQKAVFDLIKSIRAKDDHTLTIELGETYPDFLQAFAMPGIIPAHCFKGLTGDALVEALGADSDFARHPIGTGPYKLNSWNLCESVTLVPNADYFLGKPKIGTLNWVTYQDEDRDLSSGSINMARVTPQEYQGLKDKLKGLKADPVNNLAYLCLIFNTQNEALRDVNVRKALAYALNRKEIIRWTLGDSVRISNSLVPSSSWLYNPKIGERYPYDAFDARSYLSRGGYGGRKLNLRLATNSDSEGLMNLAQRVSTAWSEIGVNAILNTSGWVDLESRIDSTDYDVLMVEWYTTSNPNFFGLFHSSQRPEFRTFGGINYSNIASPRLDILLEKLRKTVDDPKRQELTFQLQELLLDELPMFCIYNYVGYVLSPKGLKNFKPSAFQNTDLWNVYEWYIEQ